MKQTFSPQWKASIQPRKQRKYRARAPWFIKRKLLSASLSKDLRKQYDRRSFPLRTGDSITILRGEFRGKGGKIARLDYKHLRAYIEGLFRTKKDGSKVGVSVHPSQVRITNLVLDDTKRKRALERKKNRPTKKVKEEKNKDKQSQKNKQKLSNEKSFRKLPNGGKK